MARGNMLLGHARGKVGSVVFSRLNGRQITRALAEQVKNPRTDGQNAQRAIFATVNGFASAVRDVVDHSFQSTKEGQESVNRFVSINVKKIREAYLGGAAVDIMPKGAGLPYANAYRFSQGSLGLQNLFIGSAGTAGNQYFGVYQEEDWEGVIRTEAELKACIPAFAPGCEIAVIKVYYNENEHFHYVKKDRAVFLSSFDGIEQNLVDDGGIIDYYLDMNKTTDRTILRLVGGGSGNKILAVSENINAADANGNKVVACVVIVSQKDSNGKWIYTTSDMMCVPAWNETHDINAAVASYGNGSASETTSNLYLQQSASTEQETTPTPFNEMRKNILLTGAAEVDTQADESPYSLNVNTDEGTINFVVNVDKGGNEIGTVQARYFNPQSGVKNDDGVLKYSVSKAGNAVIVRGTITPREETDVTPTPTKLAGWLDINIFAPQDVSGSNFTTIKFTPNA